MPGPAGGVGSQQGKDSRWLTLEVCREYARNKCTRSEEECRFAHPPSNVEVQNGRVTCCFDSIKGRCQRTDPPCKYLHPPQHLKEQLLQNGRNNLLLKNLQWHNMSSAPGIHSILPATTVYPVANGYLIGVQHSPAAYAPYYSQQINGLVPAGLMTALDQTNANIPVTSSTVIPALPAPSDQSSQPQSTTSNGTSSEMQACPANCSPSTCENTTTGHQPYWHSPVPLTSAYMVDSHTGTTYYSPAAFFQGLGAHNGLVPVLKGSDQHQVDTLKNGLTLYTACAPPNPAAPGASYLPLALTSMQSCYQPMSMCATTMGLPPPVAVAPVQRY